MFSTQYRALLNSAGWTTLPEIDETMGIEAVSLESRKSAPSRLPKTERYSLAMDCIEGEWYATPVLSFWAKVPSLSACFLIASMAGSGPDRVQLSGLLMQAILTEAPLTSGISIPSRNPGILSCARFIDIMAPGGDKFSRFSFPAN